MTGSTDVATKTVSLWRDAEVIDWFKTQVGGKRDYQTAINAKLRSVVEAEMRAWQTGGEDQP